MLTACALQRQSCAVNEAMLGQAREEEQAAQKALASKQERMHTARPDRKLQDLTAKLRDLQTRISELRQVGADPWKQAVRPICSS